MLKISSVTKFATVAFILCIELLVSSQVVYASQIKINEFHSAGSTTSNPDWVEIYYSDLDVTLYQLIDASGNIKNFSDASCSNNFCTVDWYNKLNNSGDTIKLALISSPQSDVDKIIYGEGGEISAPASGQSAGRDVDAAGSWTIFSTATKGSSNESSLLIPTPILTPTPSPTITLSSTPTSTKTPTPSPTAAKTPTPTKTTPIFTISANASSITSTDTLPISVATSGLKSNTSYYLKGAFFKEGSSNYFGKTKVNNKWVKNSETYSSQFPITTSSSGEWNGKIETMTDDEDSGFGGHGNYYFKVRLYDLSGSDAQWSNSLDIYIEQGEQGAESIENKEQYLEIGSNNDIVQTSANKKSNIAVVRIPKALLASSSTVAGVTSLPANLSNIKSSIVKPSQSVIPLILIGVILLLGGIAYLVYIKRKG